eukprot:2097376-Ditylum_brightwellii.AAC.1
MYKGSVQQNVGVDHPDNDLDPLHIQALKGFLREMNQTGVNHINCHYQLSSSCFVDATKTTMRYHPWYCGGVWYNWMMDHIPS